LLCGAVLPFWESIKNQLRYESGKVGANGSHQLVKKMRIVRVRCKKPDGSELRLVGVSIEQVGVDS